MKKIFFLFLFFEISTCFGQNSLLNAYLDSIESGNTINSFYDKSAAAQFMEEFLAQKDNPGNSRVKAFRAWSELTHFGNQHEELKQKGPVFMRDFQNNPEEEALQAEMDYYLYYSESAQTKKQELIKLRKITEDLAKFPESKRVYSLSLDRLGRTLFDFNKYSEALTVLKKAEDIFREMNFAVNESSNLTVQGVVLDALENFSLSAQAYESSTQILERLDQKPYGTISANAYNLGLLYLDRLGDPQKAVPFFRKALENDRLAGGETNPYLGDDYKMLSLSALKMGDLSQAESNAKRSVSHFELIGRQFSTEMATAQLQLAMVLHYRNKPEVAIEIVTDAIELIAQIAKSQKSDLRRQQAQSLNQLGLHLSKAGRRQEAEKAYLSAMRIANDLERDIFKIESLKGLIQVQLLDQNPEKALEYWRVLDRILLSKFQDAKLLLAEQRLNYLKIQQLRKEWSIQELDYALTILIEEMANSLVGQEVLLEALLLQTKVIAQSSHPDHDPFNQLTSTLYYIKKIQGKRIGLINSIALNAAVRPLIEESLLLIHQELQKEQEQRSIKKWNEIAFHLMEVHKRVIFETGKDWDFKKQDVDPNQLDGYLVVRQSLVEYQVKIAEIQEGNNQMKKELLPLYAKEDSLQQLLSELEEKLFKPDLSDKSSEFPSQIDKKLKSDQMLVSYFVGARQIFLWSKTRDGELFTLLENSSEKINQINRWIAEISKWSGGGDLPVFQLNDWLPNFSPKIQSLTVVPDGALCQVPMEVFLQENGQLLLHSTAVSYLPSFTQFKEERGHSNWMNWKGFAPSYRNFKLPGNQKEVMNLKELTGGTAFLDKAASKNTFLQEAPSAGMIHLAVHGELNSLSPNFSRLWFGDEEESSLTALEIYQIQLNAQLAVLSACNSGIGDSNYGNGLLSLAQAFYTAGAKSMIMSLWEVPDLETRILMEDFYAYLKEGFSKDQALRKAKLNFLSTVRDPALLHPSFWAGFVVLGEVDPLYSTDSSSYGVILIILGIVGILVWLKFST